MAAPLARLEEQLRAPEAEKVNILLVDDRPESLVALEALLGMLGQNLVKAGSGKEALRHVLTTDFAVILLDVSMPEIDGFETAALIRERERSRGTPIIFLTAALKNEAQIFKGYASGAVDYLLKPFVPDILRTKVAIFVELAKKTSALQGLNERLKLQAADLAAANKELEAFSYSVSHDLKAPLRHIDGFSRMLSQLYADKIDERGQDLLKRVQASADGMGRIIDDMLKLSRVARHEMTPQAVDLSALARDILGQLQTQEPRRRVDAQVVDGVVARCDAGLMRVLLENLLANAWKFSSQRSGAQIEFGRIDQDGEYIYFVKDNGAGFDPSRAGLLFRPFQRLHAQSEFPGTGIGLATAQRIVQRHGGRIWAESSPGQGATFFFSLIGP